MRMGISSFSYRYAVAGPHPLTGRPLTPAALLEHAAASGAEVVQFCDNLPLDTLPARDAQALLERARELGVTVELGTRGLQPDRLGRYVDLCRWAAARALRLVLDTADEEAIEGALRALLPRLRRAGVTLAIENHYDLPGQALATLVRRLGDPRIAVCLDTANSIGLLERPAETVQALAPLAVQAHLKDYVVERAPIGYHVTGRALGEGSLDVGAVIDALRTNGHDPDLFVELWMDPADSREETVAKEECWIVRSLRALRQACA